MIRKALLCAMLLGSVACYRTTVETGLPAGDRTIDIPWQKSWIYGLVPPDTINTRPTCPNGVSRVVVEHSFVNLLVGWVTWNIFTPIHPKVTCAR
ncbi:MAG: hypothetical protein IT361_05735 [Gemmatimonadaceae bacterium]|nr:hypothetical protein [Gemmatimonadaceae bacterium]